MDAIYELYVTDDNTTIETYPTISIARHPKMSGNPYHTRDHKRLFVFQVLMLPSIPCLVLPWGEQFDMLMDRDLVRLQKLRTDADSVNAFREKFIEHLKMKADSRGNLVYVPRESVGFIVGRGHQSRRRMMREYDVNIQIVKHKFEAGGDFPVIPITIEPEPKKENAKVAKCIRNIKKMVNKMRGRNGEGAFFHL